MKILLVPALVLGGLVVTGCDNDEPDVVINQSAQPAGDRNNGDSTSFSVGEDGVSISTQDNDRDGSRTEVSVGDGGLTVRTEDDD